MMTTLAKWTSITVWGGRFPVLVGVAGVVAVLVGVVVGVVVKVGVAVAVGVWVAVGFGV